MKATPGTFKDNRPSVCGICWKGTNGCYQYHNPKEVNTKPIGACSMEHLNMLAKGVRGDKKKKEKAAYHIPTDCLEYAIEEAKPFIKQHGPHLNTWDKKTIDSFITLIVRAFKTKEYDIPF